MIQRESVRLKLLGDIIMASIKHPYNSYDTSTIQSTHSAIQAAPQRNPVYIVAAPQPQRSPSPYHTTPQQPSTTAQQPATQNVSRRRRRRKTTQDKCAIHCAFCFLSILFPPFLCLWILYCCYSNDDDNEYIY